MSPSKRQKLSKYNEEDVQDRELVENADDDSVMGDEEDSFSDTSGSDQEEHDSPDTEDEIDYAKHSKSKQTLKRKRRATNATHFGATLQTLLSTTTPSSLPLSLKPSVSRKRYDEKLEAKGRKVLLVEKKEKEENGRIKDVIGGWGGESERALRKVAQRGVVKLFNVIQQSQHVATAEAEKLKSLRGTGKPTLPAPQLESKSKKRGKQKDNILGSQGKTGALGQGDFLNSIRSGGVVSKV
ncbi:RRP15 family protein [Abortiporus biennis]